MERSDLFEPPLFGLQIIFLNDLVAFRHFNVKRLAIWQSFHWLINATAWDTSQAYVFPATRRHRKRRYLSQSTASWTVADGHVTSARFGHHRTTSLASTRWQSLTWLLTDAARLRMRQLLQASTIVVLPTQIILSQLVHHSSALSKRHSLANYSILCVSDLIKALFFGS